MSRDIRLSVVVPSYNEAGNLPGLVARLRTVFAGCPGVEVVLVNNGSTDDSAAVLARELRGGGGEFIRVTTVPVNRGYGFGILSGLREARGEVLAWTHADLQTDPADVLAAFGSFGTAPDPRRVFLKGRREDRRIFDALFTGGMSVVAWCALGAWLPDINAQPKMFHRSFLETLGQAPDDFSLDLYVYYLARRDGLTVLEQPVSFAKREHGEAKGGGTLRGKLRLTSRTLRYILELRRRLRRPAG